MFSIYPKDMYFLNEIISNIVDSKIIKYAELKSYYFMRSWYIINII